MDKTEHGRRLKTAMAARGYGRVAIADAAGVKPRTVTNWTSGTTMPSENELARLRKMLGDYAAAGDPIEVALRNSVLPEWRQDLVLSAYKRQLSEHAVEHVDAAATGRGGAKKKSS